MSIKVVAVDFGGVYFTWSLEKFVATMAKKLNVSKKIAKEAALKQNRNLTLGKVTEKQYWHAFCKVMGKELDHQWLKRITENQFKPIRPVVNLMKKLRKNYKIALVTNQHNMLDDLDKKYGIYKNFDVVICSHVVKSVKPQKKIYQVLMKKTRATPEEIAFSNK